MPSNKKVANLTLQVDAGQDADTEELDQLTRRLFGEIRELDVESVELAGGEAVPAGAKSAEAITLGVLAVAVLPTLLPELVKFLQAWSLRGENRTIKFKTQAGDRAVEVEYNPSTMSPAQVKTLVETLNETLVQN
jgi:hypothetical protein